MSVPSVLLVPDCGPGIGSGHLDRSLALAEELSEARTSLALPSDELVLGRARERGVTWTEGPADLSDRVVAAATQAEPDVIVLDGYKFPVSLQSALREKSRVVIIDDLSLPCDADLLVNPAPGAETIAVPAGARDTLLGPSYSLMARAYLAAREARERQPPAGLPRILAANGGADIGGLLASLAAALAAVLDRALVDVVVGPDATPIVPIHRVTLHHAPAGLEDLLALATVYVGAAGTTSIQAAAVGVAQVIVPMVENQVAQAAALGQAGAAVVIEKRGAESTTVAAELTAATTDLLSNATRLREMGANGARLVDGRGTVRVAEAVRRLADPRAAA